MYFINAKKNNHTYKNHFTSDMTAALKFCKTCVAMKFVDDDDDSY